MTTLTDAWRSSGRLSLGSTRRWIRVDKPLLPYAWGGLLPTAGLALLTWWTHGPFAFNDIEATARREIRSQLDTHGHGWTQLQVSGQDVWLTGTPPNRLAADEALATARAATCPSAWGQLTCAVSVTGAFAPVEPPLHASPGAAPASAGLSRATSPAAACEAGLAAVQAKSKIEFASNSAQLDTRSARVLDELARVVDTCPGVLRIEGHTDARGSPEANRALSKERAAAVRAALITRGVVPGRLVARGAGAERPISTNDTETGRAANRRIEFQVVRSDRP